MRVEMRVYRQFDLDLYAIAAAGYSLSQMLETTVTAFANGRPVYILMDEKNNYVPGGKSAYIHFCFNVDNKDLVTVNLLKSVAPRMRTSFCKMVLRNSLGQQNLRCFFPGYPEVDTMLAIDANKRLLMARPDTLPISRFRSQTVMKGITGITTQSRNMTTQQQQTAYSPTVSTLAAAAGTAQVYQQPSQQVSQIQNPTQSVYTAPSQQTAVPQVQPQQYVRPQPVQQSGPQAQTQMASPVMQRTVSSGQQSQPVIYEQVQPVQTYQQTVQPNEQIPPKVSQPSADTGSMIHEPPEDDYNEAPGAVDDDLLSAFDNL